VKVEVPVHAITIKDENTGKSRTVKTLRSVDEIADYVLEEEKDILTDKLEKVAIKALGS